MTSRLLPLLNAVPAPIARRLGPNALATRLARPLVNRLLPSGMQVIVVRSGEARGARLLVDLRREKFFLTGAYETRLQHTLAELLRPGATFWDIGGHAGFFTVLAARLVGPNGHVHAFEPQPENRRRIDAALDLNGLNNVTVHKCAVSAYAGEATLHGHGRDATFTWTLMDASEDDSLQVTVDVRTLDELTEELGPPDVIKLDVEGAEVNALRGGGQLLTIPRPPVIVEFHSPALLAEGRELLSDHSFKRIDDNHWLVT